MQSVLVCGLARGQNQTVFPAPGTEPAVVVAPGSLLALQFPATDSSLTANTPLDRRSFSSFTIADPSNLAPNAPLADADATPSWTASPAPPAPEPKARPYYYNENPNKWQLGAAF